MIETMENVTATADKDFTMLTPRDVCDRCGVQAYVLVIFEDDKSLTFCGHHWHENANKLTKMAIDVVDETDRLSVR